MASYLENLMKEAQQYGRARSRTMKNSSKGSSYPPNEMTDTGKGREYYASRANASRKVEDAQLGQMLGALLQGRRYKNKTGKQIKKK